MAVKIPVGDTINYAFSFTFGNLLTVIGLSWLPLLIAYGLFYALFEFGWSTIAAMPAFDPHNTAAVWAMLEQMFTFYGILLLAMIAYFFLSGIAAVGVTNHALGLKSGTVPVYFAAGAPEWRVFGGYIRYFFAGLGIAVIVIIGILLAGFIGASIGGSGDGNMGLGLGITVILSIALYCLAILTLVRMAYLLVPTIVMEPGRGGLARSYHLTSGNFWRIFVILLVAVVPISIVTNVITSFVIGSVMTDVLGDMMRNMQPGQTDPAATMAIFRRVMEALHSALLPLLIINYIGAIFLNGLVSSGAAYAYKALTGTSGGTAPATV